MLAEHFYFAFIAEVVFIFVYALVSNRLSTDVADTV